MKKKIMASLLIGSAVVGASLAPLSAQAVTTGNTPVQVEFDGGVLPDQGDNTGENVDPDPTKPNTNFDLLAIPRTFDFSPVKIGEDLTSIKLLPLEFRSRAVMVGDLRGTKEGWHLTAKSNEMSLGSEKLSGNITIGELDTRVVRFSTTRNIYETYSVVDANDPTVPQLLTPEKLVLDLGGDAKVLANASLGRGQGLWGFSMRDITMNITTPYQQIKAGNYTGNITWNLVAGPSI